MRGTFKVESNFLCSVSSSQTDHIGPYVALLGVRNGHACYFSKSIAEKVSILLITEARCDVMMHDIKNFIFAKLRDLIA